MTRNQWIAIIAVIVIVLILIGIGIFAWTRSRRTNLLEIFTPSPAPVAQPVVVADIDPVPIVGSKRVPVGTKSSGNTAATYRTFLGKRKA